MEKNAKWIILVTLVLFLSVIPIAFIGGNKQIKAPEIKNQSLTLTGNGVFKAKVNTLSDYLSFVGLSSTNNDSLIRQAINSIGYVNCTQNSNDCKVTVGLNPYGRGYRDEVIIRLKNESDADYVGFRLSYRLDSILNTPSPKLSSYAIVPFSSITLIGNSTIGNMTVEAKNISSFGWISYTNKPGDIIKVNCSNVVYSRQGVLMKAPSCIDTAQYYGNPFGLDYLTLITNSREYNKTLDLNLTFNGAYFEAQGNFTNSNISKKLSFAQVSISKDNQSASILLENVSKIGEVEKELQPYNVTKSYKVSFVKFPSSIELGNKTYDVISNKGYVYLQYPINQPQGEQKVKLKITALFDEIIRIEAEK